MILGFNNIYATTQNNIENNILDDINDMLINIFDVIINIIIQEERDSNMYVLNNITLNDIIIENQKTFKDDIIFETKYISDMLSSFNNHKNGLPRKSFQLVMDAVPQQYTSITYNKDHYFIDNPNYNIDKSDYIKYNNNYTYMISNNNLLVFDISTPDKTNIIFNKPISDIITDFNVDNLYELYLYNNTVIFLYSTNTLKDNSTVSPFTHVIMLDFINNEFTNQRNVYIDGNIYDHIIHDNTLYVITRSAINELPQFGYYYNTAEQNRWYYYNNTDRLLQFTSITSIDVQSGKANNISLLLGTSIISYITPNNIYLVEHNPLDIKNPTASTRLNEGFFAENKEFTKRTYRDTFKDIFFSDIIPLYPNNTQESISNVLNSDINDTEKIKSLDDIFVSFENNTDIYNNIDRTLLSKFREPYIHNKPIIIHKLSNNLNYIASNEIGTGLLRNQNAINEYNNKLRLVTTTTTENTEIYDGKYSRPDVYYKHHTDQTNIYILDKSLNIIDKIENELDARYTPHFYKNILYLLNYQSVIVDLNSMTLNRLEYNPFNDVTGYTYTCDDDPELCINVNVDIKIINMSNVSSPHITDSFDNIDIQSLQNCDDNYDCYREFKDVMYDHKSLTFDKERNLFILPYKDSTFENNTTLVGFKIFDLSNKTFTNKGNIIFHTGNIYDIRCHAIIPRSFIINDILYTVQYNYLKIYDITTLQEIKSLTSHNNLTNCEY